MTEVPDRVEKQRNLALEPSETEILNCDRFLIGLDIGSRQGKETQKSSPGALRSRDPLAMHGTRFYSWVRLARFTNLDFSKLF